MIRISVKVRPFKGMRTKLIPIMLIILAIVAPVIAGGSVQIKKGDILKTKFGQLTASIDMTLQSFTLYANGTMFFNVTGFELTQLTYQFQLQSYGNGTLPIRFAGRIPISVTDLNAQMTSYISPWEQITYNTTQTTPLIVIYGTAYPMEPQSVLFRDDFLYTNPLLESSWTIDAYQTPGTNAGVYTTNGYMIMKATATATETVHVTSPMFNPSSFTTGTIVKRKMTVAMIPFAKKESPTTADIRIGLGPLIPDSNAYPGSSPYGVPNSDNTNNCAQSAITNAGIEYLDINNLGTVLMATCTDQGTSNKVNLETGLDPTVYSVLTIETSGLFCSTCTSNLFPGSGWVWFRFYQETGTGSIISSTDKNQNFTTNIDPYKNTAYAFVSQQNNNAGATGQVSKVDFVQVQNYGSPVCLIAPAGQLCTRLPPNPGHLTSDFVGSIAYIATLLGGGDEQAGAIILFLIMSGGMAGTSYLFTRNISFASLGEMSVLGFNVYAGFLPSWVLFIVLLIGAVIIVMLVNRMISGHSLFGSGGTEE